ncbi:MAG: glycosyltransferase family 2 protein [Alphaproteobacteria bacterium]|nr:glycosyltransferase family 2 protein [Alphaproteobacteria bacterium]
MSSPAFDTPVVMVVFNRPEPTAQVLARVRDVRPRRLYVLADSPRADVPSDPERCAAVRALFDRVDWPCELILDLAPRNLGCGGRVVSGLDRVFSEVDRAIVLEDDCLPHPSFFRYCQETLQYYENDDRVVCVTGTKFPCEPRTLPYSYRFSRMFIGWGWASWRRAWRAIDWTMAAWPAMRDDRRIERSARSAAERRFYVNGFERAFRRDIEPWDWAWALTAYQRGQLYLVPDRNLIANIGWGPDGTQQRNAEHFLANLPTYEMAFPLRHPPVVAEEVESDRKMYAMIGPLVGPRIVRSIRKRLRRLQKRHYLAQYRTAAGGGETSP